MHVVVIKIHYRRGMLEKNDRDTGSSREFFFQPVERSIAGDKVFFSDILGKQKYQAGILMGDAETQRVEVVGPGVYAGGKLPGKDVMITGLSIDRHVQFSDYFQMVTDKSSIQKIVGGDISGDHRKINVHRQLIDHFYRFFQALGMPLDAPVRVSQLHKIKFAGRNDSRQKEAE